MKNISKRIIGVILSVLMLLPLMAALPVNTGAAVDPAKLEKTSDGYILVKDYATLRELFSYGKNSLKPVELKLRLANDIGDRSSKNEEFLLVANRSGITLDLAGHSLTRHISAIDQKFIFVVNYTDDYVTSLTFEDSVGGGEISMTNTTGDHTSFILVGDPFSKEEGKTALTFRDNISYKTNFATSGYMINVSANYSCDIDIYGGTFDNRRGSGTSWCFYSRSNTNRTAHPKTNLNIYGGTFYSAIDDDKSALWAYEDDVIVNAGGKFINTRYPDNRKPLFAMYGTGNVFLISGSMLKSTRYISDIKEVATAAGSMVTESVNREDGQTYKTATRPFVISYGNITVEDRVKDLTEKHLAGIDSTSPNDAYVFNVCGYKSGSYMVAGIDPADNPVLINWREIDINGKELSIHTVKWKEFNSFYPSEAKQLFSKRYFRVEVIGERADGTRHSLGSDYICLYYMDYIDIEYEMNGGSWAQGFYNPRRTLGYYESMTPPPAEDIKRDGYAFDGWYRDANFKEKVTVLKGGYRKTVTLYAKWDPLYTINEVVIHLDTFDERGTFPQFTMSSGVKYQFTTAAKWMLEDGTEPAGRITVGPHYYTTVTIAPASVGGSFAEPSKVRVKLNVPSYVGAMVTDRKLDKDDNLVLTIMATTDHKGGDKYFSDDRGHWQRCGFCGEAVNRESHSLVKTSSDANYDYYKCKTCDYTTKKENGGTTPSDTPKRGDVNGDGAVNKTDALHLLKHTILPAVYTINQSGDMNGDGAVNKADALYLLKHTILPTAYPLK